MLPGERLVGGLRCSEVLAFLDAFADGTLDGDNSARVAGHVAECTVCERFGRHYADLVERFRATCAEPDPIEGGATDRLLDRLATRLDAS